MKIKEKAFKFLKDIRYVSLATVSQNKPAVRIVVVAHIKNDTIYFMTARGKPLYHQLTQNPYVALVGKLDEDIMVRVDGEIKFMEDKSLLLDLIKGHEGMYSRKTDILEMFYLNSGTGEIFDLTQETPTRMTFNFGNAKIKEATYKIRDNCNSCGICKDACVTGAITLGKKYYINHSHCVACGRCYEYCPNKAIKHLG